MTTRVIINILETGGGGAPDSIDPESEDLYLPSAYEATPFYAIIEFLIEETTVINQESGEEITTVTPAFNVTSDFDFANYGMTFTKINDSTVRLDGSVINVFTDQFYKFVLPDLTTPILPFNTETEFLSLIEYNMPANNNILFDYEFKVYQTATTFLDTTVYQWIVWKFESAVANIAALVAKGLK